MRRIYMILSRKDVLAERYDKVRYYQHKLDQEKGGDDLKLLGRKAVANLIMNLIKEKIMDEKG